MRKPTHADAELLLHLYEMRREPELRRARKWFMSEFTPTTWADIKSRYLSNEDEDRWYRMTTSYWEMLGTLVNRGVLHGELFFDHTGEDIVTWNKIATLIPDARADIRPTYLFQFEKLVADHQAYRKRTNEEAHRRMAAAGVPTAGGSGGKRAVGGPRAGGSGLRRATPTGGRTRKKQRA
jgi:hypothetical protein